MPGCAQLRDEVCAANLELVARGLVTYTWGNVSGIDRECGVVAIKPSGVAYDDLTPDKIVLLSLDGTVVDGDLRPSSDTPTHLELYRAFGRIGAVAHTHSPWATSFAQARRPIPCLGTTHADHFYGTVPVTRDMTPEEVADAYEANTGKVIVETFAPIRPESVPAVLVASHGPFTWGSSAAAAVENSVVLECVARMACQTVSLAPDVGPVGQHLLDKHFLRKHGASAYYGQPGIP